MIIVLSVTAHFDPSQIKSLSVHMGDPPEGSVADQLVSIHPTRRTLFLASSVVWRPRNRRTRRNKSLSGTCAESEDPEVLPAFFVVSLVQKPEVSNVMSEDCAPLADGISQLLGITLSCAASI